MVAIHGRNGMGNDAHTLSLLHLNGADDATTFTDSGRLGATWAATANAVTSVDDSKFGGSSLRIPDETSYISGSTPTDEQVTNGSFETGDFTGWTRLVHTSSALSKRMGTAGEQSNNRFPR